jgi:hypothetical protein
VKLKEYVSITHTETFKVTILPCKITSYAASSAITAQSYTIYYDTINPTHELNPADADRTYTDIHGGNTSGNGYGQGRLDSAKSWSTVSSTPTGSQST